ncbi:olfactory receptor 1019-like [Hyla sarda]|uniref:olfactory receptor 1019-like n=1 Tax=Hyla sarda TaxID=327740 RepID=UPI0024C44D5D|nr:olfactory receptor 1019-like [Hyla sarda]
MPCKNNTQVMYFILEGLSKNSHAQAKLFLVFSLVYGTTLLGNSIIILLTRIDQELSTPMYYFLCNLSLLDISFISVTVPNMLFNIYTTNMSISYTGCFTQLYFFHFLGSSECFLLAIMSLDRYVAICQPLRYSHIMNTRVCLRMAIGCWISGILFSCSHTFLTLSLSFCSSNIINHYFCDIPPLLQVSSTDTHKNILEIFIFGGFVAGGCCLLILISYIFIILSILKISTTRGKSKAFSTCTSHLMVVCLFFGTILFMYLRPTSAYSLDNDKLFCVFYNVFTPMLNPIIYSFRNKEVKMAMKRLFIKLKGLS